MFTKGMCLVLVMAVVQGGRVKRVPIPCDPHAPNPNCGDVCANEECTPYVTAKCEVDFCRCKPFFTIQNVEKDCSCLKTIRDCSTEPYPCDGATCLAYPDAQCVPDYCGGCTKNFFYEGEKVDCDDCDRSCPDYYAPVCDEDGVTHDNQCKLEVANCEAVQAGKPCVVKYHDGKCCNWVCSTEENKRCAVRGTEMKTILNQCEQEKEDCECQANGGPGVYKIHDGECCNTQTCCPNAYTPICGKDGKNYPNQCTLDAENCLRRQNGEAPVEKDYVGPCCKKETCIFAIHAPICANNGKTYRNDCYFRNADCENRKDGGQGIKRVNISECKY